MAEQCTHILRLFPSYPCSELPGDSCLILDNEQVPNFGSVENLETYLQTLNPEFISALHSTLLVAREKCYFSTQILELIEKYLNQQ